MDAYVGTTRLSYERSRSSKSPEKEKNESSVVLVLQSLFVIHFHLPFLSPWFFTFHRCLCSPASPTFPSTPPPGSTHAPSLHPDFLLSFTLLHSCHSSIRSFSSPSFCSVLPPFLLFNQFSPSFTHAFYLFLFLSAISSSPSFCLQTTKPLFVPASTVGAGGWGSCRIPAVGLMIKMSLQPCQEK